MFNHEDGIFMWNLLFLANDPLVGCLKVRLDKLLSQSCSSCNPASKENRI